MEKVNFLYFEFRGPEWDQLNYVSENQKKIKAQFE